MTSPVKQVVVAPSSAVGSGISVQRSVVEADGGAQSPVDSSGLLMSQAFSDNPEFKTIEKLNIVSVSGDVLGSFLSLYGPWYSRLSVWMPSMVMYYPYMALSLSTPPSQYLPYRSGQGREASDCSLCCEAPTHGGNRPPDPPAVRRNLSPSFPLALPPSPPSDMGSVLWTSMQRVITHLCTSIMALPARTSQVTIYSYRCTVISIKSKSENLYVGPLPLVLINCLSCRYKKNLKKLYVVHPTTFIKTMYHFLKPLIR